MKKKSDPDVAETMEMNAEGFGFTVKAKVFLKVGQCTKSMKGRTICHRDYDTANTEKDEFALLTIIEGISIGIERRRNTAVLSIRVSAKDRPIQTPRFVNAA